MNIPVPAITTESIAITAGCNPLTISIGVPSGGVPSEIIINASKNIPN